MKVIDPTQVFFPKLLSEELVSVQSLSMPIGTLHYFFVGFLRVTNFEKDEFTAYDINLKQYLN